MTKGRPGNSEEEEETTRLPEGSPPHVVWSLSLTDDGILLLRAVGRKE